MKTKEEILKKYSDKIREAIYQQELKPVYRPVFTNEIQNILYKALAQTREETIREVGNSIKSFFYSLDDTNDEPFDKGIIQIDLDLVDKQIKDILNKLKK